MLSVVAFVVGVAGLLVFVLAFAVVMPARITFVLRAPAASQSFFSQQSTVFLLPSLCSIDKNASCSE